MRSAGGSRAVLLLKVPSGLDTTTHGGVYLVCSLSVSGRAKRPDNEVTQ